MIVSRLQSLSEVEEKNFSADGEKLEYIAIFAKNSLRAGYQPINAYF
jgi:hypothetical protein